MATETAAAAAAAPRRARVEVVVRPRPVLDKVCSAAFEGGAEGGGAAVRLDKAAGLVRVSVARDARHAHGKAEPGSDEWAFKFDRVLAAQCSQADVFESSMRGLLDDALEGFNGTIMAYGQTGSGKTFTITGNAQGSAQGRGLAARTIVELFAEMDRRADTSYSLRVSYLEIYNEQMFDLLAPDGDRRRQPPSPPQQQQQRQQQQRQQQPAAESPDGSSSGSDSGSDGDEPGQAPPRRAPQHRSSRRAVASGGAGGAAAHAGAGAGAGGANSALFLNGLTRRLVRNSEEALACLFEGETNRVIASHELNYSSTRSHCILTLYLEGRRSEADALLGGAAQHESVLSSKLHLVDLAGSERVLKTNSSGTVLQEAKAINKSLSLLEQVVVALGEKSREHIPYRRSLLTNFLQDSLGGNCRSLLVACIWPTPAHLEQTLATLKFAQRMMRVKNAPVRNERAAGLDSAVLDEYRKEVHLLRAELALRDSLVLAQGDQLPPFAATHQPLSQDQLDAIGADMRSFVESGDHKHVKAQSARHMLAMFSLLRDMVNDTGRALAVERARHVAKHDAAPATGKRRPLPAPPAHEEREEREEGDEEHDDELQRRHQQPLQHQHALPDGSPRPAYGGSGGPRRGTHSPSASSKREKLFDHFRAMVPSGIECLSRINEAKQALSELQERCKAAKLQVNSSKQVIDLCVERLQLAPNDVPLLVELKAHKKEYREAVELLKEAKAEKEFSFRALTSCRERLAHDFDRWCTALPT